SNSGKNTPTIPVQILPLSTVIAASARLNTSGAATTAQPQGCSAGRTSVSSITNGCRPSSSTPVTAITANTALTEVRPSWLQYTSDRCRISANSSSTRAVPTPKTAAAAARHPTNSSGSASPATPPST